MGKTIIKKIVKITDILKVKDSLQKYWLYFIPGQSKVQNWFCNGLGHITILTRDKKQWYLIDPQPHRLKFEPLPFEIDENVPLELKKLINTNTCVFLLIDNKQIKQIKYKWWYFLLPRFVSCVAIVEYILGVKLKGATPWGVAKHLKKNFDVGKLKDPIKEVSFLPFLRE